MKLLVDARCVRPGRTGVGYSTESLLRALAATYPDVQVFALVLSRSPLNDAYVPNLHPLVARVDYEWHPLAELYEEFVIPRWARYVGADAFLGPAFVVPKAPMACPKLVTIHDLSVFDRPQEYSTAFRLYLQWQIARAVRSADRILCPSRFTCERLLHYFPQSRGRCEVMPFGVDDVFYANHTLLASRLVDPPLPDCYVLTVGGGQPRKNVRFGVRIVEELRDRYGLRLNYVVVGPEKGLPDWVWVYPLQERENLVPFYRHAELCLIPSTEEGFGMPALEAMACGCPVAVADRGALPEVVADAAVDIFSPEIAERLAAALKDPLFLEQKRRRAKEHASAFTFRRTARKLVSIIKQLLGQ